MSRYIYPAVFEQEGDSYSVSFPDIEGCFAQGEGLQDSLDSAEDALCLMLYFMEQNKSDIPAPSDPNSVKTKNNQFVTLISCDTLEYERYYKKKSVKKTLSIPEWLNDMAVKKNINFSNVLQNALMHELGVE